MVEHTADNRAVVGSIPTVPIFANAKKVTQVPAMVLSKLGARVCNSIGRVTGSYPVSCGSESHQTHTSLVKSL